MDLEKDRRYETPQANYCTVFVRSGVKVKDILHVRALFMEQNTALIPPAEGKGQAVFLRAMLEQEPKLSPRMKETKLREVRKGNSG